MVRGTTRGPPARGSSRGRGGQTMARGTRRVGTLRGATAGIRGRGMVRGTTQTSTLKAKSRAVNRLVRKRKKCPEEDQPSVYKQPCKSVSPDCTKWRQQDEFTTPKKPSRRQVWQNYIFKKTCKSADSV